MPPYDTALALQLVEAAQHCALGGPEAPHQFDMCWDAIAGRQRDAQLIQSLHNASGFVMTREPGRDGIRLRWYV